MATFQDWNDALITYNTQGLSISSHVFLSIDDDSLEAIGLSFNEPRPAGGWVEEFKRVVRNRCVYNSEVKLSRFAIPMRDGKKRPRYVPFLAAMVLAAHYMGDHTGDQPIDPKDFFTHLNNLLGLSDQQGRTKGLYTGADGTLWEDWGAWLRSQGFLPTASSGEGAYKYVKYPISQTILRQSDKNKLWQRFSNPGWHKNYDEVLLMQHIRRDSQHLTKHLQEILDPKSDMWLRSYEAIRRACYEVYEDWRESGGVATRTTTPGARIPTSLDAGIYRTEDFLSGTEYRIFPRQARRVVAAELNIYYDGKTYALTEDRPGWYMPLWILHNSEPLLSGLKIPIISANSPLKYMYLQARDFWVLTLDSDTPESGIYASWGEVEDVELGTSFILLARETLRTDLAKLHNEGLLEWETVNTVFEGWQEYCSVTVQSEPQAWTSLVLEHDALLTLQPRTTFSVSFVGGLRAPRGAGWFTGHGPKVALASFLPDAELTVYTEDDVLIYSATIEVGQLVEVPWSESGNCRVAVTQSGQSIPPRIVRILDWTDVEHRPLDFEQIADDTGLSIFGAVVRD